MSFSSISRTQRLFFVLLVIAVVVMAVFLIRLRERAHDKLAATVDKTPLTMDSEAPQETIELLVAHDIDDSLVEVERRYPMPKDESERARVLVQKLLEEYAAPHSPHPIADAVGLKGIYLVPISQQRGGIADTGQMAVVDLTAAFAQAQPSGIEPETLTLLSIIATLHANIPSVTQVRFLIDGQQRKTLAGHADLTRAYLASDPQMAVER